MGLVEKVDFEEDGFGLGLRRGNDMYESDEVAEDEDLADGDKELELLDREVGALRESWRNQSETEVNQGKSKIVLDFH